MKKFLVPFLAAALISGCSAVESAQLAKSRTVVINTPLVEGAQCTVKNNRGVSWYVRSTPGDITLKDGHPPLTIICTRKGYKKTVIQVGDERKNLLTLDDQRLMPEISSGFISKTPRLVPGILEETAGFAQDPFASIATKFPSQISVWMEPIEWESEDEMRAWNFEKKVYENQMMAENTEKKHEEKAYVEKKEAKTIANRKESAERWERVKKDVVETVMDPVQKVIVEPYEQMTTKIKDPETYSWFWKTKRKVTPKSDWIRKRKDQEEVRVEQNQEQLLRNDRGFSMDSE